MDDQDRAALYYALLMKDLGCSSNSARFAALFGSHDHDLKVALKTIDWTRRSRPSGMWRGMRRPARSGRGCVWRMLAVLSQGAEGARAVVRTRCERGAEIATLLRLPAATAEAIRALDEHWDGNGQPYGKRGAEIPPLARIVGVAQTFEVFYTTYGPDTRARHGDRPAGHLVRPGARRCVAPRAVLRPALARAAAEGSGVAATGGGACRSSRRGDGRSDRHRGRGVRASHRCQVALDLPSLAQRRGPRGAGR